MYGTNVVVPAIGIALLLLFTVGNCSLSERTLVHLIADCEENFALWTNSKFHDNCYEFEHEIKCRICDECFSAKKIIEVGANNSIQSIEFVNEELEAYCHSNYGSEFYMNLFNPEHYATIDGWFYNIKQWLSDEQFTNSIERLRIIYDHLNGYPASIAIDYSDSHGDEFEYDFKLHIKCPSNMEYGNCELYGNSCDLTCDNPRPHCRAPCRIGCGCPPDKPLWHDGKCISERECPQFCCSEKKTKAISAEDDRGAPIAAVPVITDFACVWFSTSKGVCEDQDCEWSCKDECCIGIAGQPVKQRRKCDDPPKSESKKACDSGTACEWVCDIPSVVLDDACCTSTWKKKQKKCSSYTTSREKCLEKPDKDHCDWNCDDIDVVGWPIHRPTSKPTIVPRPHGCCKHLPTANATSFPCASYYFERDLCQSLTEYCYWDPDCGQDECCITNPNHLRGDVSHTHECNVLTHNEDKCRELNPECTWICDKLDIIEPPCICPLIYAPVCCDGVTYPNSCSAACHCDSRWTQGECKEPCICPAVARPVCCNGQTYINSCRARCEGCDGVIFNGPCEDPCVCTAQYDPVCCGGETYSNECVAKCRCDSKIITAGACGDPCICPHVYDPVCCNGKTYGNECFAKCDCRAADITEGPCAEPCLCPDVFDPVCCGGVTYTNACFASCKCSSVITAGPCKEPCKCTKEYVPVCCDGRTYPNKCVAKCNCDSDVITRGACDDCVCPEIYDPVCCDGKTYSNKCFAHCECESDDITDGECHHCDCPDVYDPVCCEGQTFSNKCVADCECGSDVITQGPCGDPCTCDDVYDPVCCEGTTYSNACQARCDCESNVITQGPCDDPCTCPDVWDPVCCDGQTYGNDCEAGCKCELDGFTEGPCQEPCVCADVFDPVCCEGKTYSNECVARCNCESDDIVRGPCEEPCNCPDVWEPVCCEGRTYSNECFARCHCEGRFTEGECQEPCLCPRIYRPVCCDHKTYSNECLAHCHCGSDVIVDGECREPCICTREYDPVCCDGQTYSNECVARCTCRSEIITHGACSDESECCKPLPGMADVMNCAFYSPYKEKCKALAEYCYWDCPDADDCCKQIDDTVGYDCWQYNPFEERCKVLDACEWICDEDGGCCSNRPGVGYDVLDCDVLTPYKEECQSRSLYPYCYWDEDCSGEDCCINGPNANPLVFNCEDWSAFPLRCKAAESLHGCMWLPECEETRPGCCFNTDPGLTTCQFIAEEVKCAAQEVCVWYYTEDGCDSNEPGCCKSVTGGPSDVCVGYDNPVLCNRYLDVCVWDYECQGCCEGADSCVGLLAPADCHQHSHCYWNDDCDGDGDDDCETKWPGLSCKTCRHWFDGCNWCWCDENGNAVCTLIYCFVYEEPECLDCVNKLEWNPCGDECTATCKDPHPLPSGVTVPRCECPEERPIYHNGRCITEEECNCCRNPATAVDSFIDCTDYSYSADLCRRYGTVYGCTWHCRGVDDVDVPNASVADLARTPCCGVTDIVPPTQEQYVTCAHADSQVNCQYLNWGLFVPICQWNCRNPRSDVHVVDPNPSPFTDCCINARPSPDGGFDCSKYSEFQGRCLIEPECIWDCHECPSNQQFFAAHSPAFCDPTCLDLAPCRTARVAPVARCACPHELPIWNGKECVSSHECCCTSKLSNFASELTAQPNNRLCHRYFQDEQKCRLRGCDWNCDSTYAVLFGDPHTITIDGLSHHFNGLCEYYMVTACNGEFHPWSIIVGYEQCGSQTCLSHVKIESFNAIVAELNSNLQASIDNVNYDFQSYSDTVIVADDIYRYRFSSDNNNYIRVQIDIATAEIVFTQMAVEFSANGRSLVATEVHSSLDEKICGLGGKFNGVKSDDFEKSDGNVIPLNNALFQQIEDDTYGVLNIVQEFGNSWYYSASPTPMPTQCLYDAPDFGDWLGKTGVPDQETNDTVRRYMDNNIGCMHSFGERNASVLQSFATDLWVCKNDGRSRSCSAKVEGDIRIMCNLPAILRRSCPSNQVYDGGCILFMFPWPFDHETDPWPYNNPHNHNIPPPSHPYPDGCLPTCKNPVPCPHIMYDIQRYILEIEASDNATLPECYTGCRCPNDAPFWNADENRCMSYRECKKAGHTRMSPFEITQLPVSIDSGRVLTDLALPSIPDIGNKFDFDLVWKPPCGCYARSILFPDPMCSLFFNSASNCIYFSNSCDWTCDKEPGFAYVYGDPHFRTFDGLNHHFHDKFGCTYYYIYQCAGQYLPWLVYGKHEDSFSRTSLLQLTLSMQFTLWKLVLNPGQITLYRAFNPPFFVHSPLCFPLANYGICVEPNHLAGGKHYIRVLLFNFNNMNSCGAELVIRFSVLGKYAEFEVSHCLRTKICGLLGRYSIAGSVQDELMWKNGVVPIYSVASAESAWNYAVVRDFGKTYLYPVFTNAADLQCHQYGTGGSCDTVVAQTACDKLYDDYETCCSQPQGLVNCDQLHVSCWFDVCGCMTAANPNPTSVEADVCYEDWRLTGIDQLCSHGVKTANSCCVSNLKALQAPNTPNTFTCTAYAYNIGLCLLHSVTCDWIC